LNDVGSIGLGGSFSSISSGISIASSPLEVDIITRSSSEESWGKVILGSRISLDDISSLSTNVQIEDTSKWRNSSRSRLDVKHVRSVFEGSSELRSIRGKLEWISILRENGLGSIPVEDG